MKYVITGLPRSRTAWAAAYVGCAVHPVNYILPERVMELERFSDPSFLLFWKKIHDGRRVIIIERDLNDAVMSMDRAFGTDSFSTLANMHYQMELLKKEDDVHVLDYYNLDGEKLWELTSDLPYSEDYFIEFNNLNIQTMKDIPVKPEIINEFRRAV